MCLTSIRFGMGSLICVLLQSDLAWKGRYVSYFNQIWYGKLNMCPTSIRFGMER